MDLEEFKVLAHFWYTWVSESIVLSFVLFIDLLLFLCVWMCVESSVTNKIFELLVSYTTILLVCSFTYRGYLYLFIIYALFFRGLCKRCNSLVGSDWSKIGQTGFQLNAWKGKLWHENQETRLIKHNQWFMIQPYFISSQPWQIYLWWISPL